VWDINEFLLMIDFNRQVGKNRKIIKRPIAQVMTRKPEIVNCSNLKL